MARAALAYWASVFALGFVLGTARVLLLVPRLGEVGATLVELPVMLAASWFIAGKVVRRLALARGAALAAGLAAFALLLAAELATGLLAFGLSPREWLAGLGRPAGALGLAGQAGFALMPAWRAWTAPGDRRG